MKWLVLVGMFLPMAAAKAANFPQLTEKLSSDNYIVGHCELAKKRNDAQIQFNTTESQRLSKALSVAKANVADKSKSDVQADLDAATEELQRLTTEPVSVILVSGSINNMTTVTVSINCQEAQLETSISTFVNGANTVKAKVQRVDITQDKNSLAQAIIDIGAFALPYSKDGDWVVTVGKIILSENNDLKLNIAVTNGLQRTIELKNSYILPKPKDENSMLFSLQQLGGLPSVN